MNGLLLICLLALIVIVAYSFKSIASLKQKLTREQGLTRSTMRALKAQQQAIKAIQHDLKSSSYELSHIKQDVEKNRTRQVAVKMYKNGLDMGKIENRYRLSKQEIELIKDLYDDEPLRCQQAK